MVRGTSEKEELIRIVRDRASILRELIKRDESRTREEGVSTIRELLTNRRFVKGETWDERYGRGIMKIGKNIFGKIFIEMARYQNPMTTFRIKTSLKKADPWDVVRAIVSLSEDFSQEEIILG